MRTFRIGEQADLYQQGLVVLQHQIALATWVRGQSALSKKRGNSMLRGGADDEEEDDCNAKLIKRASPSEVLAEFSKAASFLARQTVAASSGA